MNFAGLRLDVYVFIISKICVEDKNEFSQKLMLKIMEEEFVEMQDITGVSKGCI